MSSHIPAGTDDHEHYSHAPDSFWQGMSAGLAAAAQGNQWVAERRLRAMLAVVSSSADGPPVSHAELSAASGISCASDVLVASNALSGGAADLGDDYAPSWPGIASLIQQYADVATRYRKTYPPQLARLDETAHSSTTGEGGDEDSAEVRFERMLAELRSRPISPSPQASRIPISFVLPAYNEEAVIAETIEACLAAVARYCSNAEVIVVDDGSRDSTGRIVDEYATANATVVAVRNQPNRGYGGALRAGFGAARGRYIFLMDSDGQFDVDEIRILLGLAREHPGAAILGYRARRSDPPMRRLNAWGWKLVSRLVIGLRGVRDIDCAFKFLPTWAVHECGLISEGAPVNAELLAKFRRMAIPLVQVPVTHRPRLKGTPTGASMRVILRAFREIVRVRAHLRSWVPERTSESALSASAPRPIPLTAHQG